MNSINVKDAPTSPNGKNIDMKAVQKYDVLHFIDGFSFKTNAVYGIQLNETIDDNLEEKIRQYEDASDSNSDDDLAGLDENSIERKVRVEKRKLRDSTSFSENDSKINLTPDDYEETSRNLNLLYEHEKNKLNTSRESFEAFNESIESILDGSNLENAETEKENLKNMQFEKELSMLNIAIDTSRRLLESRTRELQNTVSKWKDVMEEEQVPGDDLDELRVAMGKTNILLNGRVSSLHEILDSAEKFFEQGGQLINDTDKVFKMQDIYSLSDMCINEINVIVGIFSNLRDKRDRNWQEDEPKMMPKMMMPKRKLTTKANMGKTSKPIVQSRIDVKAMKRSAQKQTPISIAMSNSTLDAVPQSTPMRNNSKQHDQFKTPPTKVQTVRNKSVIESVATGSPIHKDTPRPNKSTNSNQSANNSQVVSGNFVIPSTEKLNNHRKLDRLQNKSCSSSMSATKKLRSSDI